VNATGGLQKQIENGASQGGSVVRVSPRFGAGNHFTAPRAGDQFGSSKHFSVWNARLSDALTIQQHFRSMQNVYFSS
jgi:hypothetical protein